MQSLLFINILANLCHFFLFTDLKLEPQMERIIGVATLFANLKIGNYRVIKKVEEWKY